MASREAMIDTINRAYDARGKGDIEGLMAAFHPDAVFELKGDKNTLQVAGAVFFADRMLWNIGSLQCLLLPA
jgi:ketosteroid isomerase-like protein